jgi:hypothetical protein
MINSKQYISGILMILFLGSAVLSVAQTDRKAAELKSLEKNLSTARIRVAMAQKQLNAADSLIKTGYQMIKEGKAESKSVFAESNRLDKEYSARHKTLEKLSTSDDKEEAAEARTELKKFDNQYKSENLSLEKKLKSAERKQSSGSSLVIRGKTAKLNARDAFKTANATLKSAQKKFDAANKLQ